MADLENILEKAARRDRISRDEAVSIASEKDVSFITHFEPTMDTIAEIRVMTTNYQAEFGRQSGGTVAIVTKGGGQEFHGTASVNKRHEMFNANSFFNHQNNSPKSIYRFFVWGYSIGGPVYIPKVWNTQKKRLFFFFSQEYTKQKPATESGTTMVPTTNIGYSGTAISGLRSGAGSGQHVRPLRFRIESLRAGLHQRQRDQ